MLSGKASRERFSLGLAERDCANGLLAAVQAVVRRRRHRFVCDDDTRLHVLQAARWLVDPNATPGLLLLGLCGNGKSTLAQAIAWLIEYLTEREVGYANRKTVKTYTARRICEVCAAAEKYKAQHDEYRALFKEEFLIIDDLGEEPQHLVVFNMSLQPIRDLLTARYEAQLTTILTTNLDADQLHEKYGDRLYDRLKEMMTSIVFENESYRDKDNYQMDNP